MNELPMHRDVEEAPALADLFAPPPGRAGGFAAGSPGAEDPEVRAKVARVIDELRPFINADGGDITLISVVDGVVRVAMHGACVGCGSSLYTLQLGIERKLKEEIPGIKYVEAP